MTAIATHRPWIEQVRSRIDGLLTSPAFRAWAARFPLTRPIARRRARKVFDLCAGFVYSQILLTCVRLRVFEILATGPQSLDALARQIGLRRDAAERLLKAAVALNLVSSRGHERFALGPLGAALVDNDAVLAMIEHHDMLYDDLRDPVALLRGESAPGRLAGYWAYAASEAPGELGPRDVAAYSALMSSSQALIADEVLDAYPLTSHQSLLDVGGGEGGFVAAVAKRMPQLRLAVFDLPAVVECASARLANAGLRERVSVHGGSFFSDPLPLGADIVSLVRVLHDHDDDAVLKILRSVNAVLPEGGTLLIAEPMAGAPGAEVVGDAYFGFYLLAMGSGRARTPARLRQLLAECGFVSGRLMPTRMPLQTQVMVVRRGPALAKSEKSVNLS